MRHRLGFLLFSMGAAAALHAAPTLRINGQTAFGPLPISQGSNGPTLTINAFNIGNGSLNLKLTSSDSWLAPTLGSTGPCAPIAPACTAINMALQTSTLAKGTYTGIVTVSDPNAVDAPQTITVTVIVGGNVPDQITLYAPPNGTATAAFNTSKSGAVGWNTASGSWLSVVAGGVGSFSFNIPYTVKVDATNLTATDYTGNVVVSGSSISSENKNIPVTLHVTTQPIAQASSGSVQFNIAQGAAKQVSYVVLNNAGQGTLTASTATVTTTGGNWLKADVGANNLVTLTADPMGLSPGRYTGTVSIASNAVNGAQTVNVQLTVTAAGPPQIGFGGAVNAFTYSLDEGIAQGDVLAIFGSQFTAADAQQGNLPLSTTLGTVQVLLNGTPIPVQYVSAGQINVQIPYNAPLGNATLQVVRGGTPGNTISVNIVAMAPAILPFSGTTYAVAQTAQGGYEGYPPAFPAAHAGDVLVLYAVGLGATAPAATAGQASPGAPGLANVTPTPQVCFGGANVVTAADTVCVTPFFAGLTPGYFGLYQINFVVPDLPAELKGNAVPISVTVGNSRSNLLHLAIQ